jgi:hypothetical protein
LPPRERRSVAMVRGCGGDLDVELNGDDSRWSRERRRDRPVSGQ